LCSLHIHDPWLLVVGLLLWKATAGVVDSKIPSDSQGQASTQPAYDGLLTNFKQFTLLTGFSLIGFTAMSAAYFRKRFATSSANERDSLVENVASGDHDSDVEVSTAAAP
jgi:hypothetical protein